MHVCLFDIDGTLLNSGGAGQAAMEAAVHEEFGELRPMDGISYAGRTDRAIVRDIFAVYGIELDEPRRQQFLQNYLRHLPEKLDARPGLILPGVVELLSHLHARDDVALGLLTGNFLDGAKAKLNHFGLADLFDFALGGFGDLHANRDDVAKLAWETMRRRHPDAKHFTLENVWVIGDTPADVQCGRAIGAKVLAVCTGMYSREQLETSNPDLLLNDFADTKAVLDSWLEPCGERSETAHEASGAP